MPACFANGRSFAAVVERALPGSAITYHIGFLAHDAHYNGAVQDVANMARQLSDATLPITSDFMGGSHGMGIGTLVQRKIGASLYEYIFIKSRFAV